MATLFSYDLQGKKDSFADWISNISPTDTFMVTYSKKEATPQPKFKWQTDSLDKVVYDLNSAYNIMEGADFDPTKEVIKVKSAAEKDGVTQIFKKTFTISDSALAVATHGRANELKYQLEKAGKELKNVMEVVFSSRQTKRVSSPTASARTDGLFAQIAAKDLPNPDIPTGGVGQPTANQTVVHFETADADKISKAEFDRITTALYLAGSKACTMVLNPLNAKIVANLVMALTDGTDQVRQLQTFDKRAPIAGIEDDLGGYDEQYSLTDYMGCNWCVCFSRYCPVDLVYFVHPEDITQRVLREPKASQLAKVGSSETWQLVIEAGLCLSNPFAAGVLELKPTSTALAKGATDFPATATIGADLTITWTGGKAPYYVSVTDDSAGVYVDDVNVGSALTYTFNTTGHNAGKYHATVRDSSNPSATFNSTETTLS